MKIATATAAARKVEQDDGHLVDDSRELLRKAKALQSRQAKPGTLGLPALLEERRLSHIIPDGAFKEAATFDRIFVYQIGRKDLAEGETDEKYGDTGIYMPQQVRDYKKMETPRGIIISAGLDALEHLHSNGMDLGHIVGFIRNAPWAKEVEFFEGAAIQMYIMRSGDLTGSEDLQANLRAGKVRYIWDMDTKEYLFVDETGKQWKPQMPWIADDF